MVVGEPFLTPENLAERLPSRPVLTTAPDETRGFTLQRFRHPPSTIDVPGLRDELLVDHLVGPVLVEEDRGEGHRERRWTGPRQVSLTPAGQPVRRILKGRPDVALLHLAPELLRDVAREIYGHRVGSVTLTRCLAVPDPTVDQLVRLLLAEAQAPGPSSSPMTESLVRALVIHLLRFHSNLADTPPVRTVAEPVPRIQRVIEQMRRCLDQELPLSRLAAAAGLSPSQFVRAFRDATGLSPHRYLRGLRIEKAQTLLVQTDLAIIDIALTCGFGQASHFATSFRDATGFSPRAWRDARRS